MARPRSICFTINNPTENEIKHLSTLHDKMRYLVWGMEHVYEGQGTPHIQGYVEFKDKTSWESIKTLISPRAHLERRKGTPADAAGYCKKGECEQHIHENKRCPYCNDFQKKWDFFMPRTMEEPEEWHLGFEDGDISTQGKRTDLTAVAELVQEGATIRQIAAAFPEQVIKYNKGLRDLRALQLAPRQLDAMPEVIVLWGKTGTGKTRDAYLKYWPDEPHYVWKPSNGNWWDGYDGEKKIIIDEFRGQMTWSDILGLLDRNEFRAPFKGGFVQIQADKFVITSPFPPDKWYKAHLADDLYDRFDQLKRRITKVIHMFG